MATLGDLQRLLTNDHSLTTLFLSFHRHVDVLPLTRALQANQTVQEVVVYLDESFAGAFRMNNTATTASNNPMRDLLVALGQLPALTTLSFNSRPGCAGVLTLQALQVILQACAGRLISLGFSDVYLQGDSTRDFEQLGHTMSNLFYLRDFCLMECDLVLLDNDVPQGNEGGLDEDSEEEDEDEDQLQRIRRPLMRRAISEQEDEMTVCPLDPLLMSLSILPSLKKLFLHARGPNGLKRVSSTAASALCLSASLEELKLRNFTLDQATICVMAQILQWNTSLLDLTLGTFSPEFNSEPATAAVCQILRRNSTLQQMEWTLQEMISDPCATAVAKALQVNTSLKAFGLTLVEQPTNGTVNHPNGRHNGGRPFARNHPRRRQAQRLSPACHDAFVDMLKANYVLQDLVLFAPFPVKRTFKFYTTLNRMGRGTLLRNQQATPQDWIQMLDTVKDDVNALFYYISINPSLCTAGNSSDARSGDDSSTTQLQQQVPQVQERAVQKRAVPAWLPVLPAVPAMLQQTMAAGPLLLPPPRTTPHGEAAFGDNGQIEAPYAAGPPSKKRKTDHDQQPHNNLLVDAVLRDKLWRSIRAPPALSTAGIKLGAAMMMTAMTTTTSTADNNNGGTARGPVHFLPPASLPSLR